ncbi:MAG TPA: hypothetical protein VG711_08365, partial [Phycisphaerales bacterium]|nr:hypothetical protein [Phycisphaerales bacterium]
MSERLKKQIIEHLTHDTYRPAPVEELMADLRVAREEREEFRDAVDELASAGQIEVGNDERVRLPKVGETVTGKFKLNQRGFGFVIPEQASRDGDIFVPAGSTGGAISGDRVRARVYVEPRRGGWRGGKGGKGREEGPRMVGRITDVLERGQATFVGVLMKCGKEWLVEPDGRS